MFGRPGLDRFNRPNGNLTNGGRQNNMGFAPLQRAVRRPGGNGGMISQQQPIQQRPMQPTPKQPMMQNSVPEYIKTAPSVAQMPQIPQPMQPEQGYIKSTPDIGNMRQNMNMQREAMPSNYQPTREAMPPRAITNDIVPQRPQFNRPQFMGNIGGANRFNPQMQNPFNNYNRMMQQQTLNNQIRGMGSISDAELRQRNGF